MRVLLTSPFAHPYVRRGVERYVGELADWLASGGHDVTLLTTAPDRSRAERRPNGVNVRYVRSVPPQGGGQAGALRATLPALCRGLVREHGFDVAEAHHYPDAAALRVMRPRGRYRLWLPGVPRRRSIEARRTNRIIAMYGLRGAHRLLALSRHAADALEAEYGLRADVLPPGVNTGLYAGPKPTSDREVIFCAASPEDVRKKVDVLVGAFAHLGRHRPRAELVLAPPLAEPAEALLRRLEPDLRRRCVIHVPSGSEELADLYRSATVSVLPSVDEAFGLVLVESLAAGTPVVGVRHGATPEVVDSPSIGRLAPPDDPAGLARAIEETLELAGDPATAEACRAAARRWDWDRIGPRWLELHDEGP